MPDTYQGTELWDLSLVDPDNRRPVDFGLRREQLARLDMLSPAEILERADEGLPKLWLLREALALRRRRPGAFGVDGSYQPVAARGPRADHAVAFLRGDQVLTLVPRLVLGLSDDWQDTVLPLPPGRWRNVLSGEDFDGGDIPLAQLLATFPVALLERTGGGQ